MKPHIYLKIINLKHRLIRAYAIGQKPLLATSQSTQDTQH